MIPHTPHWQIFRSAAFPIDEIKIFPLSFISSSTVFFFFFLSFSLSSSCTLPQSEKFLTYLCILFHLRHCKRASTTVHTFTIACAESKFRCRLFFFLFHLSMNQKSKRSIVKSCTLLKKHMFAPLHRELTNILTLSVSFVSLLLPPLPAWNKSTKPLSRIPKKMILTPKNAKYPCRSNTE